MNEGDLVRIKPEWCDGPEEREVLYRIVEIDDLRASISPVAWNYRITPIERVEITMIELAVKDDQNGYT